MQCRREVRRSTIHLGVKSSIILPLRGQGLSHPKPARNHISGTLNCLWVFVELAMVVNNKFDSKKFNPSTLQGVAFDMTLSTISTCRQCLPS